MRDFLRRLAAQFLAVSSVGMGGALFLFGVAWWDRDLRVEKKHDRIKETKR